MTVYFDPTEIRDNTNTREPGIRLMKTRLPKSVIDAGCELPGLETMTGADLLITNSSAKLSKCDESKPSKIALHRLVQTGLLIQRKSGRDFTSSIPRLAEIEVRMLEWTHRPWLMIIADIKVSSEGECIIDGQPTGFTYTQVEGALCWWQLRGGMISILSQDRLIGGWVNGWNDRLKELSANPRKHLLRERAQVLERPDWRDTLATFPGIGIDRATSIAEYCGSLGYSLSYLSHADSVKLDGIGPETFKRARSWLGLKDTETFEIFTKE